jgi:hypothetical protein
MVFITPNVLDNPNDARKIYLSKAELLDNLRFGPSGKAEPIIKPFIWAEY